jgi:hypothetical protein
LFLLASKGDDMLKKYGMFLGIVCMFLMGCAGAETAVAKATTVLAEKEVGAAPTALPALVEEVVGEEMAVVETAVIQPPARRTAGTVQLTTMEVGEEEAVTAVVGEVIMSNTMAVVETADQAVNVLDTVVNSASSQPINQDSHQPIAHNPADSSGADTYDQGDASDGVVDHDNENDNDNGNEHDHDDENDHDNDDNGNNDNHNDGNDDNND